jgi:hypothetical protein
MTDRRAPSTDPLSEENLGLSVDPAATDLGDDVYRSTTNEGGALADAGQPQLEGDVDAGSADLGADVERNASTGGS